MPTIPVLPKQAQYLRDESKLVGLRGGVGSGKSYIVAWGQIMAMHAHPKATFLAIGASFVQLASGYIETFIGLLERWKIPHKFTKSPHPTIELTECGAFLDTKSAEMREQLRSLEADYIVLEEPQTWDAGRETFFTIATRLRPSPSAVLHYPGLMPKIRASFNPPPVGHWIYDAFEKQFAGIYPCYRFSLRENSILAKIDPTYLPFLEATIPKDRWPREIEGEWGTVATGVYAGFDRDRHTIEAYLDGQKRSPSGRYVLPDGLPLFGIDPMQPLCWALDFNVGWMASVVGQWFDQPMIAELEPQPPPLQPKKVLKPFVPSWQNRLCYIFEEIFLENAGVPNAVRRFVELYGPLARRVGVRLYGDASGGGRSQAIDSTSSARTNWQIAIRDLQAAGIRVESFRVQSQNPAVLDRVNMVREQFRTGDPERLGFLCSAEKCPELLNDFNLVQWVMGKNDIDKTDKSEEGVKRTHLSDALGYMIWYERLRAKGKNITLLDWKSR